MLTLVEIGTIFALVGSAVFYVLLLFLSKREKVAGHRDLQSRVEEQAAQIQAMEARLQYLETALCQGSLPGDDHGAVDGSPRVTLTGRVNGRVNG